MHVLIDGYNLLHAMGLMRDRMGPQGLEKARRALVGRLAGAYAGQLPRVTVVFDAAAPPPGTADSEVQQGIRLRFAVAHEQADDLIEELIRQASSPRRLTVVSDDHRIKQAALRRKCFWKGCQEYLDSLGATRNRARRTAAGNDEEKPAAADPDRWLKEFADLQKDPDMKRLTDLDSFPDPGA